MRQGREAIDFPSRVNWDAVTTWVLCFGVVAFLGIDGGGFDPLVHSQFGIAAWWIVLLGVLVGALPRLGASKLALVAVGLFLAFVAWTALSLIWTESAERTSEDLARILTYLGLFSLILCVKAPREPQRVIAALGAAIVLIAMVGLLSRLHPAWFPSADQTAQFLADSRERLSYPLNYWNGLGALVAMGVPLVLHIAVSAKTVVARALAAAALPAMALTIVYTLSRGGIAAAVISLAIFFALTNDRLPKLTTALVAGAGSIALVALAFQRHALREGLTNSEAHHQGNELLLIGIAICVAVGIVQAVLSLTLFGQRRPRWTRPTQNQSKVVLGICVVVFLVAAVAVNLPGRASDAVDEFKGGDNAGAGTSRLNSFAGESRYALWKSAVAENETAPLIGTGSGTFEFWWDREAGGAEAVQDAHSLYLQTLGELGIVGLVLLLGFLLTMLGGGAWLSVRAGPTLRPQLAAAVAGSAAFCLSAAIDWTWRIPVLPVAMLFLGAVLVMATEPWAAAERLGRRFPLRIGLALGALVAIVAIAIPYASEDLVRQSENEARSGNLSAALADARSAQNVQSGAATPRLQQALVLEVQGEFALAAQAAKAAIDRESTNWRPWLVLSRIEAERGNAPAAVAAYRKARSLYPLSPLFDR